jgi:hypothetical protein
VEIGGANVDIKNLNGQSPADIAANYGFGEIADYLTSQQKQG